MRNNIKEVLERVEAGTATEQELEMARLWILQLKQGNALHFTDEQLVDVSDQMWAEISKHQIETPGKSTIVKLWPRVAAIAAAVTAIAICIYFFKPSRHPELVSGPQDDVAYNNSNDIAPGRQGATLTLANGKTIKLTNAANGKLAEQSGVTVTKSANGRLVYEIASVSRNDEKQNQINTLSTAKGETYDLTLPDGTLVSLNAASSLEYPANFIGIRERRVKLTGEGYFQVAKDKAHPFIVATATQEVQVLGTHFNINAYADEASTKTTLLEGRVQVSSLRGGTHETSSGQAKQSPDEIASSRNAPRNDNQTRVLKPGEQSSLEQNGVIKISPADVEAETAWKNGYFSFNDESIQNIMRIVSRWYDIDVAYEGKVTTDGFNGKISRFKNISQVLKMLEDTKLVHFKVEGRRVLVKE